MDKWIISNKITSSIIAIFAILAMVLMVIAWDPFSWRIKSQNITSHVDTVQAEAGNTSSFEGEKPVEELSIKKVENDVDRGLIAEMKSFKLEINEHTALYSKSIETNNSYLAKNIPEDMRDGLQLLSANYVDWINNNNNNQIPIINTLIKRAELATSVNSQLEVKSAFYTFKQSYELLKENRGNIMIKILESFSSTK